MSAYLVVQGTVTNWEKFKDYTELVPKLVANFGGHYVAMGSPEVLEGNFDPKSAVISMWPNTECIHKFWHSPEYKHAMTLREGAGNFSVMIIEGVTKQKEQG